MGDREWSFLLDENISPEVKPLLGREGFGVETVGNALGYGADDRAEILPYARSNDLIIVTQDIAGFGNLEASQHEGLVLVFDQRRPAEQTVEALANIATVYERREAFDQAALDSWFD